MDAWEKKRENLPPKMETLLRLPAPRSRRHPRMKAADRAVQFAPFAALTGLEEALSHTADFVTEEAERPHTEPADGAC